MSNLARLLTRPRLIEIVALTDDISDQCGEIADALATYENADDLAGQEQTEERQQARELAVTHIEELLSNARRLESIYERLTKEDN